MAFDIDSFLEKYNKDLSKETETEKVNEKINFDFQKDTEDKILKAEKKIKEDKRFELLEKIYDEVKKFDEDIPSKFIGIENKSNIALKEIGEKYSEEFLLKIKENVSIVKKNIEDHIRILDTKLNTEEFVFIIKEFETIIKYYEVYPKEFINEKMFLSSEIRKREIIINKKIQEYKITKLRIIKNEMNSSIIELNKSLVPENIEEIEGRIMNLHRMLRNIPKIFLTEIIEEKILISKILIKAENYLESEYIKEFNKREINLNMLFENFHTGYINKDLQKTLIIYDEILLEFQSIPEVFFEKKIEIYKKINNLYAMINDLFLKNNLNLLMQSYNTGQILKETREYIKHVKNTMHVNPETLQKIKEKISKLSEKSEPEKSNLLKEIKSLEMKYSKKSIPDENLDEINENVLETRNNSNPNNEIISDILNVENSKEKDIKIHKETDFSKEILEEINLHYEKIQKSNNPKELKILYKKIMFYIDTVKINSIKKKELIGKINKTISQKKFA